MKVSWKMTQRLSDLSKGTQLGVGTGVEKGLSTYFPHKTMSLKALLNGVSKASEKKPTLEMCLNAILKDRINEN